MIFGYFHQGSGLGNQLHRYVMTRVVAADKGWEWGMYNPHLFKGSGFMSLDMGKPVEGNVEYLQFREKEIRDDKGVDIRGYDPEINFIQDWTELDGEFQDERYFQHRLTDIRQWLKTEFLPVPDNVCVIGFRGGEFTLFPDLFLPQSYWDAAVTKMREINPDMKFRVVTDDPKTAQMVFPHFPVSHEIGLDWRQIRYAQYAIVSNSSFYILPRLLNNLPDKITIAPRYWARHNTKTWALPQNFYSSFSYL